MGGFGRPGEWGRDVFVGAVHGEFHGSRPAPHEEVADRARLHLLPFEKNRLGAALTAHHAYGLALHDLRLRVDAGTGPVAEAIANHLGQMAHELVIALELVALYAYDGTVIGNPDQKIATLCVEKRGNCLEHSVRDAFV